MFARVAPTEAGREMIEASRVMDERKKRLKKEYLRSRRVLGVFLIRNLVNDKIFVGVGLDLTGIINSHKFQLAAGVHRNRRLQSDWNALGGANFAFEILDQLEPREDTDDDGRKDLAFLEELWLERLQPYGARGYNKRKLTREEMLGRITANRSGKL